MNAMTNIPFQLARAFAPALVAAVLAACAVGPEYERPAAPTSAAFKEAQTGVTQVVIKGADGTQWKTAEQSEALTRGEWWTVFGDPALDALEAQATDANQDLKAAAARLQASRAINQATRAQLFPQVDAGLGATRQKSSAVSQRFPDGTNVPTQTIYRAQAGISYEADLFGRVSSSLEASRATAERTEALYRTVQLALQADVAQNYFTIRQLDAEAEVFAGAVRLREKALQLVQRRFSDGDTTALDESRAKTELANAKSDAMTVQRARAAAEHSLAVLLGKTPAEFSVAANPLDEVNLKVPAGLPSSLLERRPDIAAAERAMTAANARVGVAKAAFFPSLSLTGAMGFESGNASDLFKWSSRSFVFGPLVGTALNLPLFDGGRRSAQLDGARAEYDEQVALYRQQVLTAFKEVEDGLSDLRILEDQVQTQIDGAKSAADAAQLSRTQYREGAVTYLEVIDAERTVLQSRRAAAQLSGMQAIAAVNLIRALGGGWETPAVVLGANIAQ